MDEYSGAIVDAIRLSLSKPAQGEADPAKIVCVNKAKRKNQTPTQLCPRDLCSTNPCDELCGLEYV
jgi:hypothetical protein